MKNKKKERLLPTRLEVKTETSSSKAALNNRLTWIFALTIAFVTFLVYLPALNNGFVNWDDGAYVYENNAIRVLDFGFLKWAFTNEFFTLWHPLTMFSFAVDYAIGGLEPGGYHLTNNLFHAFNTSLVFFFTVKVVKQNSMEEGGREKALIVGIVTALLFGIHPIHVESVAWISERKDVLSAFFYLLSLLAYLSYASAINSRKHFFYWVCLVFFVLALMSKPMAVSLPIVLLILDFHPLGRLAITNIKPMLVEKLPFFLLSLFTASVTIWAHLLESGLPSSEQIPILYRLLTAVRAYMFYIVKMILPLDLAPLYPLPSKIVLSSVEYLGSLILWLIITLLAIWSFKRGKLFLAVWGYYIVTLIPVIGIIQVGRQAAADRYTYLPSIGLFLIGGLGIARLFERYSKKQSLIALIVFFVIISGSLSKMTVQQIAIWRDSVTLWTHEIKLFPGSAIAYFNLGEAYYASRNYRQAIEKFSIAIELDPTDADTYTNRGLAYYRLGDDQRAMKDYEQAISINPKEPIVYNNRGLVYDKLGNYQQATKDYNKAIELNPRYGEAYDNRGGLYFTAGDYQSAMRDYNKAIELDPQFAKAYYNRGTVYNSLGSYPQAIEDFSKAIELNPKDSMYYTNRGSAYNSVGNHEQAIKDYNKAIELNPKDTYAYYNLGSVYSQIGNIEQAIINYKKAATLGLKEAQELLRQQGS